MSSKSIKSHLFLLKLIEGDSNKYCADCGSEGTRWASWNLGIFLCIRCAGIHRKLGVHISKVKSVDLDSWTSEQLQSMETKGNRRSHLLYEAQLPSGFVRPQTNYAIEEFIRAKYEYRRYVKQVTVDETAVREGEPNGQINDKRCEEVTKPSKSSPKRQKEDVCLKIVSDSDSDSLSDPEYLKKEPRSKDRQKKGPASGGPFCHKVHSDGDLIKLHNNQSSMGTGNVDTWSNNTQKQQSDTRDLMLTGNNHKESIMALYQHNPSSDSGKQHNSFHRSDSASGPHHSRGYGSAGSYGNDFGFASQIPATNQNSYLRQIQDKLTNIKSQLTTKFSSYEQPGHSEQSSSNYQSSVSANRQTSSLSGQTLSPDLWR